MKNRALAAPVIDAILMASGFSRRFGAENKLLLPFHGQPLALHTLRLACGHPGLSTVWFVCADNAVAALAEGCPARVLRNPAPQLGQRHSIRLGVRASRADGWLFFPCDQPLLDTATVNAILAAWRPGIMAAPAWAGRPGSPTLFAADYREELLSLPDGSHARDLRRRHPACFVTVPASGPLALLDIDTAADLARLEGSLP